MYLCFTHSSELSAANGLWNKPLPFPAYFLYLKWFFFSTTLELSKTMLYEKNSKHKSALPSIRYMIRLWYCCDWCQDFSFSSQGPLGTREPAKIGGPWCKSFTVPGQGCDPLWSSWEVALHLTHLRLPLCQSLCLRSTVVWFPLTSELLSSSGHYHFYPLSQRLHLFSSLIISVVGLLLGRFPIAPSVRSPSC